jgi:hypothetical protein
MRSIEHRALSAPAPTTPRKGHPVPYRFAQLMPGDTACVSWVGVLPLERPRGGGR